MGQQVRTKFRQCPACMAALVLINGEVEGPVVLWGHPHTAYLTVHAETCHWKGHAAPSAFEALGRAVARPILPADEEVAG